MATIDLNLLPAVLRGLRLRRGRTQVEVAAQAGVPQANLSRWESGKVRPSLESLVAVLTALGIDFRDLQDALEDVLGGMGTSGSHARSRLSGSLSGSARMLEQLEQLDRRVTRIENAMTLEEEQPLDGDRSPDAEDDVQPV